jgi:hypothetical protein
VFFGVVVAILSVAATLATIVSARRATNANPMDAPRHV